METAGRFKNWPVTAGQTVRYFNVPALTSVDVSPGDGGTMNVQVRVSPSGELADWPSGSVSAATQDMLEGPIYEIIFSADTADGIAGLYLGEL